MVNKREKKIINSTFYRVSKCDKDVYSGQVCKKSSNLKNKFRLGNEINLTKAQSVFKILFR